MRITYFDWDNANTNHIARHNVSPDEAEEVFQSKHIFLKTRNNRYLALGTTEAGRYLVCVFEKGSQSGSIRIVTARDMTNKEKRYYRNAR